VIRQIAQMSRRHELGQRIEVASCHGAVLLGGVIGRAVGVE
jgi:hypothetical protein